jgi:hypothetical protein
MLPLRFPSVRGWYRRLDTMLAVCMSRVMLCGSGTTDGTYWVCQPVALLPSMTLAAAPLPAVSSWLSALTVQKVRLSVGSAPGSATIPSLFIASVKLAAVTLLTGTADT